jgi:hypothetical protein
LERHRRRRYVKRMRWQRSVLEAGAIAAFGVALSYLASGLAAVMMPAELQGRPDISPHQFWLVLSRDPTAHLAFHWSWVAAGFCGLAAVPAISLLVWPAQPGAVLWSGAAAWYGFAVLARSHLMEVAFDRKIIGVYPTADPAFQQAVHVVAGLALDVPDGFLTYGAIGVWVALVSWLGRRDRLLPPGLGWLGFVAGLTYFTGVVGYTFGIHELLVIAVGVGGLIVVPAWFVWVAVILKGSPG